MSNVMSFVGNIGRDAELKDTSNGSRVLTVAVANTVGFGDKQKTIWFRVQLWGQRGEKLAPFLRKGQQVFVSGEMSLNEFTGNDGVKKTTVELNASVIDLVGKKDSSAPAPVQYTPPPPPQPVLVTPGYEEDIPF
jgi:single-strand DNA-binding protein